MTAHPVVGRFLSACQATYRVVGAWEIWSPQLRGMLARQGFQPAREVLDGEPTAGMVWRAARPVSGPCGGCGVVVVDGEVCWWCHGPLCSACWEAVGHCGHPAEAENERARARLCATCGGTLSAHRPGCLYAAPGKR